ncbi:MAG: ZIP family metal transporter [Candidatus Micrarchaeota archaeon]|nr:ZIP family metal transporter [Candidatus Micrarchaeota archaeon]
MIAEALVATFIVSMISLVGVVLLVLKKETLDEALFYILSFATGTMLGAAFMDLLPESIGGISAKAAFAMALAGIILFFILERVVHWHHAHHSEHPEHEKPLAYLSLLGDALHNFFDGVAIAASFTASPSIGIATTIAIIMHEIPQELGDFTLLLYGGFSVKKALASNLLVALTAFLGVFAFFGLAQYVENLDYYGMALAAGSFIYIAGSDLIPELHKETKTSRSIVQLVAVIAGIVTIWLLTSALGV